MHTCTTDQHCQCRQQRFSALGSLQAVLEGGPLLSCVAVVAAMPCRVQGLVQRIREVLDDSRMQARAAEVAGEVSGYAGVSQAADVALSATSPWSKLQPAAGATQA